MAEHFINFKEFDHISFSFVCNEDPGKGPPDVYNHILYLTAVVAAVTVSNNVFSIFL